MLNALVIADRQPQVDLLELVDRSAVELVITLGDLSRHHLASLADVDLPKIGVYGNHCAGDYLEDLGFLNLHRTTTMIAGVTFAGVEGCVRYKQDPDAIMYTQAEYRDMLAELPPVDVIISHCPPKGINDAPADPAHQGIDALRDYLHTARPKALLHGHTYRNPPRRTSGATEIYYVRGASVGHLLQKEGRA